MADKKSFFNTTAGGLATGGLMDGIGSLFTIGAQKRAATTAWKRQNEFWDRQNAYNTPANQMKRLKSAGLNPALMYGQGNVGNAERLSGVQKADVSGPALAQSAAAGAQMSLINAQRNKIEEEAELLRNQQVLSNAQAQQALANTLKISADKSKVIQETLNLKTQGDILQVEEMLKKVEKTRADKGTIKGDALGNMLTILNLDPVNNAADRTLIQGALTAYFGAKVASDIISSITRLRTPKITKIQKGGK
jgi:hypothetical protein